MNPSLNNLPESVVRRRLVDTEAAAAFVGRSVFEIRRLTRKGLFPKPIKLNGRRNSWRIGDLINWIDAKVAEQKGD